MIDTPVPEWLEVLAFAVIMCAELNGRSASQLTGKSIIKNITRGKNGDQQKKIFLIIYSIQRKKYIKKM